MSDTKLKRCPFCGGEAVKAWRRGRYGIFGYVECMTCGAETRKFKVYADDDDITFTENSFEEAAYLWNQRDKNPSATSEE